ncbi:MAG: hypothetical protein LBV51_01825 [Acholeplasmatales bacterium]|jgi:hypothetical protein|nr:hypothetical protein [Acholeplasmatales bacterium]
MFKIENNINDKFIKEISVLAAISYASKFRKKIIIMSSIIFPLLLLATFLIYINPIFYGGEVTASDIIIPIVAFVLLPGFFIFRYYSVIRMNSKAYYNSYVFSYTNNCTITFCFGENNITRTANTTQKELVCARYEDIAETKVVNKKDSKYLLITKNDKTILIVAVFEQNIEEILEFILSKTKNNNPKTYNPIAL